MDRDAFTESSVERLKLRDENKRLVCRALQRLQRVCMNSMVLLLLLLLLFRCRRCRRRRRVMCEVTGRFRRLKPRHTLSCSRLRVHVFHPSSMPLDDGA